MENLKIVKNTNAYFQNRPYIALNIIIWPYEMITTEYVAKKVKY